VDALSYVVPVGEQEEYIERALRNISESRPAAQRLPV